MDDFIAGLIRIIFLIFIFRRFFKKSKKQQNKTQKRTLTPESQEAVSKQKSIKKAKRDKLKKALEMKLEEQFSGKSVELDAIRQAFAEQKKSKHEISLQVANQNVPQNTNTVTNTMHSIHPKPEFKSAYERVKTKNKKTTLVSRNERRIGKNKKGLIDKDTLSRDIVRAIVFKEILSEPRAKKPYEFRR